MKLGLISDIHGDVKSLRIALDILQGQGAQRIICLGDVVERGPDGVAAIQLLRESQILCVQGNHDEAAVENQRWWLEHGDLTRADVRWRLLLDADALDYLKQLPFSLRFIWRNKQGQRLRVLLAHGTPASHTDYLLPNSAPRKFAQIAQTAQADVILYGHTHQPLQAFFAGVWFFNPGMVYGPAAVSVLPEYGGRNHSTCATLTLPDCTFRVFNLGSGEPIDVPYIHDDSRE